MAWYRTGSVSVTNGSTTVTGSGTAWVGAINAGWGFSGPDGTVYEIATVVSSTQITLASPYQGGTQSGASYSIIPTQGLEQNLVVGVNGLLTNYQGVYDGPGQGKFPDGTVAAPGVRFAADEDTGLYRPASNQLGAAVGGVQRTLLSSTAYEIDVPMAGSAVQSSATDGTAGKLLKLGASGEGSFGLGATGTVTPIGDWDATDKPSGIYLFSNATANLASKPAEYAAGSYGIVRIDRYNANYFTQTCWRAAETSMLPYRRRYVNGTWGSWTRLYDEYGSNANGSYIRHPDGTQVCWRELSLPYSAPNVCLASWTYPAAFSAAPKVVGNASAIATATPLESELSPLRMNTIGATSVEVRQPRIAALTNFQSGDSVTVQVKAIGRWL